MAEQATQGTDFHAQLWWQLTQEPTVFNGGIVKRVIVADLCKVIVTFIGVAALAVVEFVADRIVIVSLQARHPVFCEQGKHPIRVGAERTHVAQAKDLVCATLGNVTQCLGQREVIAVNAS